MCDLYDIMSKANKKQSGRCTVKRSEFFLESLTMGKEGHGLSDLVPLTYGREACAPGHSSQGIRDYYMIHYVCSGKGRLEYRGERYDLSAGQIFIISRGEWHRYEADGREPWTYEWVCFRGERAEDFAAMPPVCPYRPDTFHRIIGAGEYGDAAAEYVTACLFETLSILLKNTRTEGSGYAERARRMVDTHYMLPITVGSIATALSLDRRYLPRLFRARYGTTLKEYLTRVRMENAARCIAAGYNAEEAGRLSGYEDPVNFYRMFKRYFGEGPAAYRRRLEENAGDRGKKNQNLQNNP